MKYVEAPERWYRADDPGPSIFLAGGITACEDWQTRVRVILRDDQLTLLNPRRAAFNAADGASAAEQIAWEYNCLCRADVTMFWFPSCDPAVTTQPIALFELGTAVADARHGGRKFVVGVDDNYPRLNDVFLQLKNAMSSKVVHRDLASTVAAARESASEIIRL